MGRPDQELSFVYVDDLTAALLLATDDAALERTYFASHSETVTGHRLLRVMALAVRGPNSRPPWLVPVPALVTRLALASTGAAARVFGHATVLNRDKANEFLAEAWTCSADALSRDTGWEAETASAEGWKKTVAWYRQHGWL
jgi:nucleoside-diphosphate-sugar epimerase